MILHKPHTKKTQSKKMDQRLYKATIESNIESLSKLIQEDSLILDRTTTNTTTSLETPLHIAAMLGHEQFAIELLKLKPQLARELDSRRSTALHIASAKGNLGIVKALLMVDPDMCFASDRDGRNPVHVAAMRGRIGVLREMLRVKPEAARALVNGYGGGGGGSVLHLCVEYYQFEALKVLMENVDFRDLINCGDGNGNTVLHLSVADKQIETTDYLLSIPAIQVNAPNLNGVTPMDILIQRRMDMTRDLQIEESLKRSRATNNNPPIRDVPNLNPSKKSQNKLWNQQEDWLEKKRSALMVVASLIATMAFQVGTQPPENVWQNTNTMDHNTGLYHYLRTTYNYLKKDARFYMINTTSFIASLSIILLLMSGLPLKNRVFMWILMVITWIAITALALTYTVSVALLTPPSYEKSNDVVIGFTVFLWICLMVLLLLGHTIRLFVMVVKLFVRVVKLVVRSLMVRKRRVQGSAMI